MHCGGPLAVAEDVKLPLVLPPPKETPRFPFLYDMAAASSCAAPAKCGGLTKSTIGPNGAADVHALESQSVW